MLMFFIFIPCYLAMLGAVIYTNHTATEPNGNILLGCTISVEHQKDECVLALIKRFKKIYHHTALLFLFLIAPSVLLINYSMTSVMYLMAWFCLYLFVNQKQTNAITDQVMELKKEKGWFNNQSYTISIDTEVSRLKSKMPVSLWWMFLSFIFNLVSCLLWYQLHTEELPLFIGAQTGLLTYLICLLLTIAFRRQGITTISENTEINLALNHVYRHEWTQCFTVMSFLQPVLWLIAYLLLPQCDSLILVIVMVSLSGVCTVVPLAAAYQKVKRERNHILTMNTTPILVDDDIFWRGGTYNNPNDSRFMVEKRIGIGTTFNMASKGAKVFTAGIIVFVIICFAPMFYFWRYDYSSYTFIQTDQTFTIDAPPYEYSFTADQIINVDTIEKLPSYYKNNGYDSATRCFGKFRVKGYGQCQMYITCDNAPYIVVTLNDATVILNGSTPEETAQYLQEIQNMHVGK